MRWEGVAHKGPRCPKHPAYRGIHEPQTIKECPGCQNVWAWAKVQRAAKSKSQAKRLAVQSGLPAEGLPEVIAREEYLGSGGVDSHVVLLGDEEAE